MSMIVDCPGPVWLWIVVPGWSPIFSFLYPYVKKFNKTGNGNKETGKQFSRKFLKIENFKNGVNAICGNLLY